MGLSILSDLISCHSPIIFSLKIDIHNSLSMCKFIIELTAAMWSCPIFHILTLITERDVKMLIVGRVVLNEI